MQTKINNKKSNFPVLLKKITGNYIRSKKKHQNLYPFIKQKIKDSIFIGIFFGLLTFIPFLYQVNKNYEINKEIYNTKILCLDKIVSQLDNIYIDKSTLNELTNNLEIKKNCEGKISLAQILDYEGNNKNIGKKLESTQLKVNPLSPFDDDGHRITSGYFSLRSYGGGNRKKGRRRHKALDLVPSKGKLKHEIYALRGGIVTKAGWLGNYGKSVEIKTDEGYYLLYAHLSKIKKGIKVGERVIAGDTISYMGNSGYCLRSPKTGKKAWHLHLEAYYYINKGDKIKKDRFNPIILLRGDNSVKKSVKKVENYIEEHFSSPSDFYQETLVIPKILQQHRNISESRTLYQ